MAGRLMAFEVAVLTIILATTVMTGRSSRAESSPDTCLGKPNAAAPKGSHWNYRVDPTTHRRCWFVRSFGAKRSAALPKRLSGARSTPILSAAQSRKVTITADGADEPIAPKQPAGANESVSAKERIAAKESVVTKESVVAKEAIAATEPHVEYRAPASNFSPRWHRLSPVVPFLPTVMSNNDADEVAPAVEGRDDPLIWPILTIAEADEAKPAAAFHVDAKYLLPLALCVLALVVMVGCVLAEFFSDRRQRRVRSAVHMSLNQIRLEPTRQPSGTENRHLRLPRNAADTSSSANFGSGVSGAGGGGADAFGADIFAPPPRPRRRVTVLQ